ncbi:hypothetical protein [Streptomyces sp. Root264]|uniref:hypothetical protein n=1 Tax=Streptomyces sp. Root264 TaxID=1736503 RepID=UPI0012FEF820|nr:hypothetical protein [Streptomyces sp. Root264]
MTTYPSDGDSGNTIRPSSMGSGEPINVYIPPAYIQPAPPPYEPLPISIYLSDEAAHQDVERAVGNLLEITGLQVIHADEPVIGSWFRRLWASSAVRSGALTGLHMADQRLVLAQDAAITSALMQGLPPLIAALDSTKDAVVRIGAVLIVKLDWQVFVFQLTAEQQVTLNHQPHLVRSPQEALQAMGNLPRVEPPPGPIGSGGDTASATS